MLCGAEASVLLPFTETTPLEEIEQTDLYAMADDGISEAQFKLAVYYESQKKKPMTEKEKLQAKIAKLNAQLAELENEESDAE